VYQVDAFSRHFRMVWCQKISPREFDETAELTWSDLI